MLIHRKTYRLYEEERVLVYEDVVEDAGVLIYKDYESPNNSVGIKKYDSNGLVIEEKEMEAGQELSRDEYVYNSEKKIISKKLFVAGELFEEKIYTYDGKNEAIKTIQNGEEIALFIETNKGEDYVRKYYEEGTLVEKQECVFDSKTREEHITTTGEDGKVFRTTYNKYNADDNILLEEERNGSGILLKRTEQTYIEGKRDWRKVDDHDHDFYYEIRYGYDDMGNEVSMETRTPSGKLLEYHKKIYDHDNFLISENGYSQGNFDAIYGTYVHSENYHFEHEYEIISQVPELQ